LSGPLQRLSLRAPGGERLRYALLMGVLFVAYVTGAKLGIEASVAHGVITPVWAPTGIALAALVLYGPRLWPAVALGAFVANATSGLDLLDAAFISVGNTLEAVVGCLLLLRVGFRPELDRVRDVFSLIVYGALVSTAIAATNGVTVLWISGDLERSYGSEWLLWWIGDGMGNLIVAPLMFVLSTRPWRQLDLRARLEGLVVLAVLIAISATVFLGGGWRYPHLLFPVLIWATLRFQQFGAVTSSLVVAVFAVTGAVRGTALVGQGGATEIVQVLEALTAGVAVSLLILGAVLSERREAQRALATAHASLAEAQEVAHLGSWEWDIASDRVAWSDELYRLWGLEPQSVALTYERYLDSVHPADRDRVRTIVEQVVESATPFDFEHRIVLPDDSVRWIHASGRVISDESGVPVRMVGVGQDITERKRVDDLRDSILSAVSHELRTPLTSIIGFSITLKDKGAILAQRTRDEMVGHLAQQAGKLDRLLSDLLDLDRLRHGFMRPNLRPTNVQELAARVASDMHSNTHAIDVDGSRVIADVDAPKVERIIENLLANAVNHTPPGTTISVSVEPQDSGVLIAVDDDGPGVAEEQREAIFGIFNRGTASDRVPGTGIGLSLVAQFTALHGGNAWVEESAAGGASFRVFLPGRRPS
jgi:PAS domain S-box-containing protein